MKLYFLRHGLAGDRSDWKGDDFARPLTEEGIAEMKKSAVTIGRLGLELDLILTSPFLRAHQTAEIVAKRLKMLEKLVKDERLAVGMSARSFVEVLALHSNANSLLFVGHEPGMGEAVKYLIGGGQVVLQKGGLACVELLDAKSIKGELVWLLPPEVLALS